MNHNDLDRLNELMKDGWSYSKCECEGSSTNASTTVVYITDVSTSKKYKLFVDNGKLQMSEVTI